MKNNKGFTLIELIIAIALINIILPIIFLALTFSFKTFEIQNERTNIISNARITMNYLTREIRKANVVEIDENGNLIIDSAAYKIENRVLFKNNKKIIEGIDELNPMKTDKTVNIEIIIKDGRNNGYKFSSSINVR